MANNAFDEVIINPLEKPLADDINAAQSNAYLTQRDLMLQLTGKRAAATSDIGLQTALSSGFIGTGISLTWVSGMGVLVRPGFGFQYDATALDENIGGVPGLNDLSPFKPLVLTAVQGFTAPAADPTNPRRDIVEVRYNRDSTDLSSREVLNTTTGVFAPTNVDKTLSFVLDGNIGYDNTGNPTAAINYKEGTPAGSPAAPSVDTGYIKIGEVYVPAAASALSASAISDFRPMLWPGATAKIGLRFKIPTAGAFGPPTDLEIDAPPGISVVVVANAAATYGATVYVFAGRGQNMIGIFRPETDIAITGGSGIFTLLQPTLPADVTVDSSVQTAIGGANALPVSAAGLNQLGKSWAITPYALTEGANVAYTQTGLTDPLQISGQILILGGS